MADVIPTQVVSIKLPGENTIYATPQSGNVLKADPGTRVTWICAQAFQITFYALDGSRTDIPQGPKRSGLNNDNVHEVTIPFPDTAYLKYVVQANDPVTGAPLTLDPYIHVD